MEDAYYMKMAFQEALVSAEKGEIPVGAVVVCEGRIIARCHNQTEMLNDVTAHAEILAITSASSYLGGKYLDKCTLFVTLEPCIMCAGAIAWSQIGTLVYGANDETRGYSNYSPGVLHPKTIVRGGIMKDECSKLLVDFFKTKR
jgi:tRNA(adenine34) deaminase